MDNMSINNIEYQRELREIKSIFKDNKEMIEYCKKEIEICNDNIRKYNRSIKNSIIRNIIIYATFGTIGVVSLMLYVGYKFSIAAILLNITVFYVHTRRSIRAYTAMKEYEIKEMTIYKGCIKQTEKVL